MNCEPKNWDLGQKQAAEATLKCCKETKYGCKMLKETNMNVCVASQEEMAQGRSAHIKSHEDMIECCRKHDTYASFHMKSADELGKCA